MQARKGKGILGGSSSTFRKVNSVNKKKVRLSHTARKSVPGGPYRIEGFRLPEQVEFLEELLEELLDEKLNYLMAHT
ncbi:hypothetical protein AgCh_029648 [Apium graveolens]